MTKLTVVAVAIAAFVLAVPTISQADCGMPHGRAGMYGGGYASMSGGYGGSMYGGGYGSGYQYTASYGYGRRGYGIGARLGYNAGETVSCGSCEPVCQPVCDPCDPCRRTGLFGGLFGW